MSKKTVVVGASSNPSRYAYLAAQNLTQKQHEVVLLSIRSGVFMGNSFLNLKEMPPIPQVDTITLYINPFHQAQWEDYLLSLKPKRIIFNPGTENSSFESRAETEGIATLRACTLVMLNTGQY